MSQKKEEFDNIFIIFAVCIIAVAFTFKSIVNLGEQQKDRLNEEQHYAIERKINNIEYSIAAFNSSYYTYNIGIIAEQYHQIKNNSNIISKIQLKEKGDFYETPPFMIEKNYTVSDRSGKDVLELSLSFNNQNKSSYFFKKNLCYFIFHDLIKSEKIYGIKTDDNIYKYLENPGSYCEKIFEKERIVGFIE